LQLLRGTGVPNPALISTQLLTVIIVPVHLFLYSCLIKPAAPTQMAGFKVKISERGFFPKCDDGGLQMVLFRSQEIRRAQLTSLPCRQSCIEPKSAMLSCGNTVWQAPALLCTCGLSKASAGV
jgi:hypothetical protein